jgi:hydroxyacyl-ACP dehydratase HTD2-like protein with hotdog domain
MTSTPVPEVGEALPPIALAADPVRLFAYSALTWNPHRIHYDAPYTVDVEGYPGLVVQGPMIGGLLMRCAQEWAQTWDAQLVAVDYRSTIAVHEGVTVTARGEVVGVEGDELTVELQAVVDDEVVGSGTGRVRR